MTTFRISDEILTDCLQDVAQEVEGINEEIANHMYTSEFLVDQTRSPGPDAATRVSFISSFLQKVSTEAIKNCQELPLKIQKNCVKKNLKAIKMCQRKCQNFSCTILLKCLYSQGKKKFKIPAFGSKKNMAKGMKKKENGLKLSNNVRCNTEGKHKISLLGLISNLFKKIARTSSYIKGSEMLQYYCQVKSLHVF